MRADFGHEEIDPMCSRNPSPIALPPWRRWFLATAIALEAAWIAVLATLAVLR